MGLEMIKSHRQNWLIVIRDGKFVHWSTNKPVMPIAGQQFVLDAGIDIIAARATFLKIGLDLEKEADTRFYKIVEKAQ